MKKKKIPLAKRDSCCICEVQFIEQTHLFSFCHPLSLALFLYLLSFISVAPFLSIRLYPYASPSLSLSPLAFLFSIYVIPLSSVSPIPYLSLLSFFAPLITLLLYLSICPFCYFTLPFSICNNLALVLFLFLSLSLMLMCCICLSIPLHRYF